MGPTLVPPRTPPGTTWATATATADAGSAANYVGENLHGASWTTKAHAGQEDGVDSYLNPHNHPFAPFCGQLSSNDGGQLVPALRLRGLPFDAQVPDITTFFAEHDVHGCMKDGAETIKLLPKPNKRPSGQAVVLMKSRGHADEAKNKLHGKWMGHRYIEVFAYGNDSQDLKPKPTHLLHLLQKNQDESDVIFNDEPPPSATTSPPECTPENPEECMPMPMPKEEPVLRERHIQENVAPATATATQEQKHESGTSTLLFKQMAQAGTLKVKNTFLNYEVSAADGYDFDTSGIRRMFTG